MEYTVNLGCWGSIFAVPTDVVDQYLKIAGSAQLKVLLYILRHSGKSFGEREIAAALNMDAFDVKDCIEFWVSFGVIAIQSGEITPAAGQPRMTAVKKESPAPAAVSSPIRTSAPVSEKPQEVSLPKPSESAAPAIDKKPERPADIVMARPLRPDPIYVAKRINEDEEFAALLNEAQYIQGRPLSPNENSGILMLHDNEGLPSEVILMLLTYGASNQMGMKQIEAMGASWARDGIKTLEQADEKIRRMEESKESYRHIQRLLGLEYRRATETEEALYTCWLQTWKFSDDMIKEAYDINIEAKGKYIPKYVNRVLERWHSSGIKTIEQAKDDRKKGKGDSGSSDSGKRSSSFNVDDLNDLDF